MKSKTTTIWFALAVALAAAIWILNAYFPAAQPGEKPVLAGLRPVRVTELQVGPAGTREIVLVRTNKTWQLEEPVAYPAQAAPIDSLLDALQKLTPVASISPGEMNGRKNADAEFGFDNPQFRVDLTAGGEEWHLLVGNKTAPGDGVYVRVVGATEALVTDTSWLKFLPRQANDWRDTALVDMPDLVDWLVITNGTQAIELRRNMTNRLWRMVRPLSARANNLLVVSALDQLRRARVSQFVNDDPKADLTAYGLEPAALDVWLGAGASLLTAVHGGKDVPDASTNMYARRDGWNSVVATPKDSLSPWRHQINDFRDPNLLELDTPVEKIEVHGEFNYSLQSHGSNVWTVAGQKFAVDPDQVATFVRGLGNVRIASFVQDVVTASGLKDYGLTSPSRTITLYGAAEDTNSIIAQVLFGASVTNQFTKQVFQYVKRGDEDYVYAVASQDLSQFSLPADCFRARNIWSFSETNVAEVTVRQNGRMRQMIRNGANDWSLATNSQGIINPPEIEETVHRLGELNAFFWVGRDFNDAGIGLTTNSLSVTVELKSGEKYAVAFGGLEHLPSLNTDTPLAVVTLDGERWAFLFPPALWPLVAETLIIPSGAP